MKVKDKIFTAVAVTAFLVLTLFVFAPGQIFLTNPNEFNASYFELLGYLFIIALPVFLLISILLTFLLKNETIRQRIIALLLSLAFLFWLQGNILLWNYGQLTGSQIHFNIYYLIVDATIWLAVITTILIKYKFFYKYAVLISCAFIVIQAISTSILVYNQPEVSASKRYEIDRANEFTFSTEKNVIILVLDTFQSDVFREIIEEDESYQDIFEGFTFFPDALAGFPTTYASIANILTGQYYDNSIPFPKFLERSFLSSNSIPKILVDHGFEVDCFANNTPIFVDERVITNLKDRRRIENSIFADIFDTSLFRYAPDFLKKYIYNDGEWFLKNIISTKAVASSSNNTSGDEVSGLTITSNEKASELGDMVFVNGIVHNSNSIEGKNIFKFYRLDGCHAPYLLNERLEYEKMNTGGYKRQAKASLQITKIFLEELKRLDVFNNSMIIVIGDHGLSAGIEYIQKNANPLFLIKRFNNSGQMTISNAPVALMDIPNTILAELGLTGNQTGPSVFSLKESDSRQRRFLYYNWQDSWTDYLPAITEYFVSSPVWLSSSWRASGNTFIADYAEKPLLEWAGGFHSLEGSEEKNWRWCSGEGTLVINNETNNTRKFMISTKFYTGHSEMADLVIESSTLSETLTINDSGYSFSREINVEPGANAITFKCNAERVDAPDDPRYLVFRMENFQISEVE